MAETIRWHWFTGIECAILEIHKPAWFLTRYRAAWIA
jgi:hypothetical protein